jgi:hypothetical protein
LSVAKTAVQYCLLVIAHTNSARVVLSQGGTNAEFMGH